MTTLDSPGIATARQQVLSTHIPTCSRCHQPLGDQLVRALDGTFHPECFTCLVSVSKDAMDINHDSLVDSFS